MALLRLPAPVKYTEQLDAISDFLRSFKTTEACDVLEDLRLENDGPGNPTQKGDQFTDGVLDQHQAPNRNGSAQYKYLRMIEEAANRKRDQIVIELDDLKLFEESTPSAETDQNLVASVLRNTHRYIELFSRAIDRFLPEQQSEPSYNADVLDIIMSQRSKRNQKIQEAIDRGPLGPFSGNENMFPPELTRRYTLNFKPITSSDSSSELVPSKALAVRNIRGEHLGHLITVRGIVTRVSDVKPAIQVNAYSCDVCGYEIFQTVTGKQFVPLVACVSEECKANGTQGQLFHSTRASKFTPFQEIKIQEMADQVPVGHIPRQLTVHCVGALCRQLNPGDQADLTGIFTPVPYTGLKALKAGLLTDTFLDLQWVRQHKQSYDDTILTQPTLSRMSSLQQSGQLYEFLARSIAPEIYGHLDVKKVLLLQLIGGVSKEMGDGMRIRGDINVCLMGDPGVAKSQLLKYISKIAPRGVYTTGRGSSGVGLTAAVMRDPVTDEMILEGGALVLADNGTCCIDEFDKMDDNDRTAIHEVMEQQTISISKAGISTSLNARTSILAAANPLYGRYNPRISPVDNINLPAALLTRFDVLILILDTPDRNLDEQLAQHVTHVHIHNRHPDPAGAGPGAGLIFTQPEIRQWVARARSYRPVVPRQAADYCVGAYVRMREQQKREEMSRRGAFTHTTPRSLLAVIRLSQALARLRFAEQVIAEDVDEALRLTSVSRASLSIHNQSRSQIEQTPASKIYSLIRNMFQDQAAAAERGQEADGSVLDLRRVKERILIRGFTNEQFESVIDEYSMLDVWQVTADGALLVLVNIDG